MDAAGSECFDLACIRSIKRMPCRYPMDCGFNFPQQNFIFRQLRNELLRERQARNFMGKELNQIDDRVGRLIHFPNLQSYRYRKIQSC